MPFLWQTYVDNVDPFMKVLHVRTMSKLIRELRGNFDSLGPGMRALVQAIALAAIMSLEDEEIRLSRFEAPRGYLADSFGRRSA